MTNKDAIKVLENVRDLFCPDFTTVHEAINHAIRSLVIQSTLECDEAEETETDDDIILVDITDVLRKHNRISRGLTDSEAVNEIERILSRRKVSEG